MIPGGKALGLSLLKADTHAKKISKVSLTRGQVSSLLLHQIHKNVASIQGFNFFTAFCQVITANPSERNSRPVEVKINSKLCNPVALIPT